MRVPILFINAVTTFAIGLMFSVPADAKPRPNIGDSDAAMGICLGDGGDSNWGTSTEGYGCAGLICYCCYDDGCYICDNTGHDCTWDGKYSSLTIKRRLRALGLPTTRPTTVNPGLTTRPPRVAPIAPSILEGGGLSTQGPAPAGRPTAPPPSPPVQLR